MEKWENYLQLREAFRKKIFKWLMAAKIVYRHNGRYKCPFCRKENQHSKTTAIAAYRKRWHLKAKPAELANKLGRVKT